MAKIILAWESGQGLSHVSRLVAIGNKLLEQGHCIYVVVHDVTYLQWFDHRFKVLPSPSQSLLRHDPVRKQRVGGYSDHLSRLGFNSITSLTALLRAWDDIFYLVKPDLLIADQAPLASLAARGVIPCLQVSDAFNIVPITSSLPRLRPDVAPITRDEVLLENILFVQSKRSKPLLHHLSEVNAGKARFICHLPELDPYQAFRKDEYCGSLVALPTSKSNHAQPQFFAYLTINYPGLEDLLVKIAHSSFEGSLFIPHAPTALKLFLQQAGKKVFDHLPSIKEIVHQHNVIIHHGGLGLAQLALHAGIAQIVLPINLETDLTAYRLQEQQVAARIDNTQQPYDMAEEIVMILNRIHSLNEWAHLKAQQIQQRNAPLLMDIFLASCQSCLN